MYTFKTTNKNEWKEYLLYVEIESNPQSSPIGSLKCHEETQNLTLDTKVIKVKNSQPMSNVNWTIGYHST